MRLRNSGADLAIEPSEELFKGRFAELQAGPWTLSPDGSRLLAVIETEPAPVLTLVLNWAEELR